MLLDFLKFTNHHVKVTKIDKLTEFDVEVTRFLKMNKLTLIKSLKYNAT